MSEPTTPARPTPLRTVASHVSTTIGLGGAILTALVGWGILSVTQQDALTGLAGLIPGIVTAATATYTASKTAKVGERFVTPNRSPMTDDGRRLIPEVTDLSPGVEKHWRKPTGPLTSGPLPGGLTP